jgi:phosphoribosylaminoimidazole-succinocarboxamide synthase
MFRKSTKLNKLTIELKNILLKSNLPHPLFKRGKVRDIYNLGNELLIVSTDRISAFDVVLPDGIPHKGQALNMLSVYWFKETDKIINNHFLKAVDSRTVLVKKCNPIKAEFVVRGYIYGSAWEKYRQGKKISGVKLPSGLKKSDKLPGPILTPTTKAQVGHDVEITMKDVTKMIGKDLAEEIQESSLKIYETALRKADQKGIIIADTKLEFGLEEGQLLLIDEVLTPDSSRFWPKTSYQVGKNQYSFDKQYVRDYLTSIGWNKKPPAPTLPNHIVVETARKYIESYERLTSKTFSAQITSE